MARGEILLLEFSIIMKYEVHAKLCAEQSSFEAVKYKNSDFEEI